MTVTAIVTICISVGALLVSFFTLYLTFFYRRTSMVGTLAGFDWTTDPDESIGELHYSLANTGNQALLVRLLNYYVVGSTGVEPAVVPEPNAQNIPIVIEPGAIELITIKEQLNFFERQFRNGKSINVQFDVYAPNGKQYFLLHTLKAEKPEWLNVSDDCFLPFSLTRPS